MTVLFCVFLLFCYLKLFFALFCFVLFVQYSVIYLFNCLSSRILHLESGRVVSESLLQKPALRDVTSFEAYISDVIGRDLRK